MRLLISLISILLSAASLTLGESRTKRYLYLGMPDGAQQEGRSAPGILIFDIDDGHEFVRRIDVPIFSEGLRGFTGNLKTHSVYYSTTNRRLGCFDLEKEKIAWEKTYEAGCDRSSITPNGKKIYVPTGWWRPGEDSGFLVVNAENGELIKRIRVGPQTHNSIVSLDGRRVFLGTRTMLTTFDTATDRVIGQIKDVGERGVFPYTIDSRNRIGYVCLGNHVGFDVVNLEPQRSCTASWQGINRFPIVRMERLSPPMKASCGSATKRAGSCLFSTPRKCPPSPRATSSYPRVVTGGCALVWMVTTPGPIHLTFLTPEQKSSSLL